MIRVGKLADYGLLILTHLAQYEQALIGAEQLANETGLARATTRKVLNQLVSAGLISTQRGPSGGYSLAKPSSEISLLAAISAVEGPLSLTACCTREPDCDIIERCRLKKQWASLNDVLSNLLDSITLDDLLEPDRLSEFATLLQQRSQAAQIDIQSPRPQVTTVSLDQLQLSAPSRNS